MVTQLSELLKHVSRLCHTFVSQLWDNFETHQLNWTGHVFQFLRKLNLNTWQWDRSRSYHHFDTMLSWKLWWMPHLWSGAQTPPFFRCVLIHWQTAIHSTPNYATRFVCVRCFTCWQSWLLTCVDNMTVPSGFNVPQLLPTFQCNCAHRVLKYSIGCNSCLFSLLIQRWISKHWW